jgi:hypothetical protein
VHPTCEQVTGSGSSRRRGGLKDEIALVFFAEQHVREPGGVERVRTGKSLSVEHWEETCDYYVRHFSFGSYGRKWRDRKGRAIHTQSDFMWPLYEWGDTFRRPPEIERLLQG